jgi:hypothetical protein
MGLVAALSLTAAASSYAASSNEPGIAVGANGVFQPGLRFTAAYQSNVYKTDAEAEGDLTLQISPHLWLLHSSQNADFRLGGEYYLKKYTNAFVDSTVDPVGHRDLDVFLNYMMAVDLVTRPQGKFSFLVGDELSRYSTEFDNASSKTDTGATGWQSPLLRQYSLMDRLANDAHIGVAVRPGTSLEIEGLFHFDLSKYSGALKQGINDDATGRRTYGQSFDFYGTVDAKWRFFPRTSLLFSAEFGHVMWSPDLQESLGANMDPALTNLNQYDSNRWRVWFGVQGKFSRKLSVQGMIGYGNAYFVDSPEDTAGDLRGGQGLLGRIQLHWAPVATQRFSLGFQRDFRHVYFSNYYITTSPYLRYTGQIAGFLMPSASFSYALRQYSGDVDRKDHEIRAGGALDFQLTKWLKMGAHYSFWSIVASDYQPATFADHEISLKVEVGF